jgi:succinoglycan biosynthesis transport protein ExoP
MADLKDGQGGDSEGAKLRDLESKLLEAQNSYRLLEARVGSTGVEGATVDGAEVLALANEVSVAQSQLAQAKITFGARHPTVTGLEEQVRMKTAALQTSRANSLAVQQGVVNKLKTEAKAEQTRLLERRILEDKGSKLMLELQLAKDNYANALRGLDQVQFASEGDYKDVTKVSDAVPPVRASKPNKMKLFLAAFVLSFGLAIGGPFAYELLLDRRIRCRDDLERGFRIVTLAQFGRVTQPRPA